MSIPEKTSTREAARKERATRRRPRKKRRTSPPIRFWVQITFAALCVWIGYEFYRFVTFLETGGAAGSAYRPPGVEGFLPISSLMSLYHFVMGGGIHPAHPAGPFILLAVIAVSWLFGKSFCVTGVTDYSVADSNYRAGSIIRCAALSIWCWAFSSIRFSF